MRKRFTGLFMGLSALALAFPALAAEHGIGKPLVTDGMIMRPVYLQSVEMAPVMPGLNKNTDVHLELDIHADKNNKQGFDPGAWIPYLTVSYVITKQGSDWMNFGSLMAMVANDGPHYGANVALDGPGKYHVSFKILPPPYQAFYRHTTKDTGVPAWWSPIRHSWDFTYVGVGKKGGY
jgi:uncharacterized protein involved in high-affinity Fe2+ transport